MGRQAWLDTVSSLSHQLNTVVDAAADADADDATAAALAVATDADSESETEKATSRLKPGDKKGEIRQRGRG